VTKREMQVYFKALTQVGKTEGKHQISWCPQRGWKVGPPEDETAVRTVTARRWRWRNKQLMSHKCTLLLRRFYFLRAASCFVCFIFKKYASVVS